MIPKVIHYCWFGRGKMPDLALKCIASWQKFLPNYEIKKWDEDNFDVNIISYTAQAYKEKKYAFVSDFARFWILYNYGGVYFDTDVEIIKPMEEIINQGPFMGCEKDSFNAIAPGLGLCSNSGLEIYNKIIEFYNTLNFYKKNGSLNLKTVVEYTTIILRDRGFKNISGIQLVDGILIYPPEYFCPMSYKTGKISITEHTYTIHHYVASWVPKRDKLKKRIKGIIGGNLTQLIIQLKHKLHAANWT